MEFLNPLFEYFKSWQLSAWMLIAIAIIVVAVCFLIPIKKLNEFAKEHIAFIILGAFLIYTAIDMAHGMAAKAGF